MTCSTVMIFPEIQFINKCSCKIQIYTLTVYLSPLLFILFVNCLTCIWNHERGWSQESTFWFSKSGHPLGNWE